MSKNPIWKELANKKEKRKIKLVTAPLVVTFTQEHPMIENGGFAVDEGAVPPRVVVVATIEHLKSRFPNAPVEHYPDKVLLPGLVNLHTHFYSALARGISLSGVPPTNFVETLQRLWWRLDRVLDMEGILSSGRVGLIDGVHCGITTFFDHHASFSAVGGSLDKLADAVREVGVRACLCYEVSDRQEAEAAVAGIEENVRFLERLEKEQPTDLAGMMGLHAQFTVTDETMARAVEAEKRFGCGFHIHVAEDNSDQKACEKVHKQRVVQRLAKCGLLRKKDAVPRDEANGTILAHCIHMSEEERKIMAESDLVVAHNPESNLNNAVGIADISTLQDDGTDVVLGSDGFCNGIIHSLRLAYLLPKHLRKNTGRMFMTTMKLLQANMAVATRVFRRGGLRVGCLSNNSVADWIAIPYNTPTPPGTAESAALMHLIFGILERSPTEVVCNNKVILKDSRMVTVDESAIMARARQDAANVWQWFLDGQRPAVTESLLKSHELSAAATKAALARLNLPVCAMTWVLNGHSRAALAWPRVADEIRERLSDVAQKQLAAAASAAVDCKAPAPAVDAHAELAKALGVAALHVVKGWEVDEAKEEEESAVRVVEWGRWEEEEEAKQEHESTSPLGTHVALWRGAVANHQWPTHVFVRSGFAARAAAVFFLSRARGRAFPRILVFRISDKPLPARLAACWPLLKESAEAVINLNEAWRAVTVPSVQALLSAGEEGAALKEWVQLNAESVVLVV